MYPKPKLFYPKEKISLIVLRNLISDQKLNEFDSILLNKSDLDELALEYRETFKERFMFELETVSIEEDFTGRVSSNSVGIARNSNSGRKSNNDIDSGDINIDRFVKHHFVPNDSNKFETIYRCELCSKIVDFDGSDFIPETAEFKTQIYEKYNDTIELVDVVCEECEERERHNYIPEEEE